MHGQGFSSRCQLTIVVGRVLVEADPVVVAVMADVLAVQVAGVHLVVATRALGDADLHEARLGVLALGARYVPAFPGLQEVVPGWQVVVVGVILSHRDKEVVRVVATLPLPALIAGGVLEAHLVAAAASVLVPGPVHHAVV